MKLKSLIIYSSAFAVLLTAGSLGASAQEPTQTPEPTVERPAENRFQMLKQLGLTREQLQQIRRMNAERKPLFEAAQRRFREAQRALDEAIYSDEISEQTFQDRLKEVQLAQAELLRVRFQNELGIRRVLTPAQLTQFREFRMRFAARSSGAAQGRPVRQALREMQNRRRAVTPPADAKKPIQ